jgi:hypothetical protein
MQGVTLWRDEESARWRTSQPNSTHRSPPAVLYRLTPLAPTLDQSQGAVPRKLGGMETL